MCRSVVSMAHMAVRWSTPKQLWGVQSGPKTLFGFYDVYFTKRGNVSQFPVTPNGHRRLLSARRATVVCWGGGSGVGVD